MLRIHPCLDSDEMAAQRQLELNIPRDKATSLGRSAVEAIYNGYYSTEDNARVEWGHLVRGAHLAKMSIPPELIIPESQHVKLADTWVQVTNETTLAAAKRLVESGLRPLALNFANGVVPGGGFLDGARAQEEVLCRSSALYHTLIGDPMYEAHRQRQLPDFSDWVIYSPNVPVFRTDIGMNLPHPWLLSFLTCAAPYAPAIGQPQSGDLLQKRILRVLSIARSYHYEDLVLGAWGCGAFGNDPHRTARDFRRALEVEFNESFANVVFAIVDWSEERRFLGPFREMFS